MIKAEIIGGGSLESVSVGHSPCGGVLFAMPPSKLHGTFKASTRTTAGTTNIVTPKGGGSICVTDIIVTTEKKNLGTVTVSMTDGTNTINLIRALVTDAPCNLASSIAGRFPGWKNARIDMITVEDFTATVTVGYIRVPANESLSYADWDALR